MEKPPKGQNGLKSGGGSDSGPLLFSSLSLSLFGPSPSSCPYDTSCPCHLYLICPQPPLPSQCPSRSPPSMQRGDGDPQVQG